MKAHHFALKHDLQTFRTTLCDEFVNQGNITHLTRKLVEYVDGILITLFHEHHLDTHFDFCLIALGGYGRRELQLYSDIDLLILHQDTLLDEQLECAQRFIQSCWDLGLEISHQVTTIQACADLAQNDLSVISSLLDMRLICGKKNYMEELRYATHAFHMWTSHDYFTQKAKEQQTRHAKYNETAYNLEPNVKNGPGGLRDLQIIFAIAKRHFGIHKPAQGIHSGFITEKEYEELMHCQHFLWRVRFALHMLARKREDRLLFDYQVKLAKLFGYQDTSTTLAIEQFMKAYFNVIKHVRELNEMLLQWFFETIVHQQKQKLVALDDAFQLSNQYIEIRHPRVFVQKPKALLDIFFWLAKRPDIEDVRANTIRFIRQNLYLMNRRFRASKAVTKRFMTILKQAPDPYDILQRMSRYGVLGQYLDCFASVTGQMQYDLFHAYTVEQHTLFVIRNLSRFSNIEYATQFPLCAEVMALIPKREILYLAALFHDIAKGRGGDHSKLGAKDALNFAVRHRLTTDETQLLVWLVEHHLLMSQTAQRQDIYDPQTIAEFCANFPQKEYLDYLYLLTVADICGTNPNLWNAWKDSLLKELYHASKQLMALKKSLLDEQTLIEQRKKRALSILRKKGIKKSSILPIWVHFKGKYFLHESPDSIAKHMEVIHGANKEYPIVLMLPHHSQGGTEIFIYMPHKDERFTITTTVLSNHHINILEAHVLTCDNQFDLDTYVVLDEHNQPINDPNKMLGIQQTLITHLKDKHLPTISKRRLSRTQAHFHIRPQIKFSQDKNQSRTLLFLIANDRAGLLALVSRVFLTTKIHLHSAKIVTAGTRAEDMFFISNRHGLALTEEEQKSLQQKLILALQSA